MIPKLRPRKPPTFEGFGRHVLGEGPTPCRLMIVGEAPGGNEDRLGRPFVGQAGQLLVECLLRVGLKREQVYITNAIHRRPPANRKPTTAEVKAEWAELEGELERVQPAVVVAMGDTALRALTGKAGITKHRGIELSLGGSMQILPTFHPAYALRNPSITEIIVGDLRRAVGLLAGSLPTGDVLVQTVSDLRSLSDTDRDALVQAPVLAYDVETAGLDPSDPEKVMVGIGLSATGDRAFYFLPPTWRWLAAYVFSGAHKYVAHNGKFDNRWLRRYGIEITQTFDTMLAAYLLDENRGSFKLERLAVEMLGVPPYHTDTEEALTDGRAADLDPTVLGARCGRDCAYTFRIYQQQREELLKDTGLTHIMQHILMPLSRLLEQVEGAGIPIDIGLLERRLEIVVQQALSHVRDMKQLTGDSINFNSSQALARVLFEQFNLPVVKRTPGGKPSTDKTVLAELKDRHPFVQHLLDYRKCMKYESAYYRRWQDKAQDGLLRGNFWLINVSKDRAGTRTGRLSGDLQQIPRQFKDTPEHLRLKDLFIAPPGFVFLEADYSQIELRCAAWLANEPAMLAAYREGRDLHTETARAVLGAENPTEQDRSRAKPVNFGFLYGMGAEKFQRYALTEYKVRFTLEEAEAIRRKFFATFHGLPRWYLRQEMEVKRTRQVRGPLGQIRRLPDIRSPDRQLQGEAVRQAINTPVQQVATQLLFLAAIEFRPALVAVGGEIVNLVHDSFLALCPEPLVLLVGNTAIHVMTKTVPRIVQDRFGVTIPIPLEAEVKVGRSWGAMQGLTKYLESATVRA